MSFEQCGDEGVGGLTGIEASVIQQVRRDCIDLAAVLRSESQAISNELLPLVESAEIPGWVSSARATYDLSRWAIRGALAGAQLSLNEIADTYDHAVRLLDLQIAVEF